jgi:hypothetical protein
MISLLQLLGLLAFGIGFGWAAHWWFNRVSRRHRMALGLPHKKVI